jgi:pectate lyase
MKRLQALLIILSMLLAGNGLCGQFQNPPGVVIQDENNTELGRAMTLRLPHGSASVENGIAALTWTGAQEYPLLAFPGAEGFGRFTVGGRGGIVRRVTNLNASGTGSLRAALEDNATSPTIVVFDTGGIIELAHDITVRNSYVTIAGQTAPGDGICIKGAALRIEDVHDVIVRGLRIRVGDGNYTDDPDNRDALVLASNSPSTPVYNVIVDHCSFSWASDENVSTFGAVHDVTFSWNIIAEPLMVPDNDGYGLLVGGNSTNISVHHNLFAGNRNRSPQIHYAANAEVINNLVYNWRWYALRVYGESGHTGGKVTALANYYKPGPEWTYGPGIAAENVPGWQPSLYVKDNVSPPDRSINSGDDWLAVGGNETSQRANAPTLSPSGVTLTSVDDAYWLILDNAGATHPARDRVDTRILADVRMGTGAFIESQNETGGYPSYSAGTPLLDTDADGMPDIFELAHGLDINSDDSLGDYNGDGRTNIEEYINSLIIAPASIPSVYVTKTSTEILTNKTLSGALITFREDNQTASSYNVPASQLAGKLFTNYGQTDNATLYLPGWASITEGMSFTAVIATKIAKPWTIGTLDGSNIYWADLSGDGPSSGTCQYITARDQNVGSYFWCKSFRKDSAVWYWLCQQGAGTFSRQ